MNGLFSFIVLPYVALLSLIAGSFVRWYFHGFKVSSLSSQILESRILFFGIRPFHWGIVLLLTGHLVGFLFPASVLAWNGKPVRLYILEIAAFAFAVTSLIGLVILIIRRTKVKRIRVVTTRMDIVVFLIMLMIIITGLYTALFHRWGSSWFALVMVPYLRSVLSFKPDIVPVVAMPVMVKLHIVSTFIFFGIIPYTRFIHILVYPFSYLWRQFQVVIWNKNSAIYRRNFFNPPSEQL